MLFSDEGGVILGGQHRPASTRAEAFNPNGWRGEKGHREGNAWLSAAVLHKGRLVLSLPPTRFPGWALGPVIGTEGTHLLDARL